MNFIKNFIAEEDGVTAIEYALIAALIGVAIVAATTTLGGKIASVFTSVGESIKKT